MFSLCLDPLLFATLFARQIMAAEEIVHTIYKTLYFNIMPVFFFNMCGDFVSDEPYGFFQDRFKMHCNCTKCYCY